MNYRRPGYVTAGTSLALQDLCMKTTTDQRAVSLLLWIFAILAIGQLTLHHSATESVDEAEMRAVGRQFPALVHALESVRDDLLTSSLLSILGLALGLFGFNTLRRRLDRRRLKALEASASELFARATV